jgi:hypothetical protein
MTGMVIAAVKDAAQVAVATMVVMEMGARTVMEAVDPTVEAGLTEADTAIGK